MPRVPNSKISRCMYLVLDFVGGKSKAQKLAVVVLLILNLLTLAVDGVETSESPLREVPATEILTKIQNGKIVEYNHITVKGDLNLSMLDLPTKYVIKSSYEIGSMGLSQTQKVVNSTIRIIDSAFEGPADFSNAHLNGGVDLSGSNFTNDFNFGGTTFSGDARFGGATFSENAGFSETTFNGYAGFDGATFNRNVGFFRATFSGDAGFNEATFNRNAGFFRATFSGDAGFRKTTFIGDAGFNKATFSGDTWFNEATFNRNAGFGGATFSENAGFDGATFNGYAGFNEATFSRDAGFDGATFSRNAGFDGATFGGDARFNEAKFEGYFSGWSTLENTFTCDEATYQGLIKNFKEHGQFDEADDCYFSYRYRNMDSLQDLLGLISCGFGVRPSYAVYLSIILIVIFGFLYWIGGGIYKLSIQNLESISDKARTWSLSLIYNFLFSETKKIFSHIRCISNKIFRYKCEFKPENLIKIPNKLWHKSFTTNVSLKDALYFSALVFFTLHPPHDWEYSEQWRYVVLFEDILGGVFITLFIVTLGNVIIRY